MNSRRPARPATVRGTREWIDEHQGRLAAVHQRAQLSLDAEIGADVLFPIADTDTADTLTLF